VARARVRRRADADSAHLGAGRRIGSREARAARALGRARPREAWTRKPGPAARGVRDVAACGALAQNFSLVLTLK
jgi:hypothetical protein